MAALSDYAENKILDHVLGTAAWTMPANIYVALHTAAPDEDAIPTNEVTAGWYARKQPATGWNTADTVTPANGSTNNGLIQWDVVSANITITHVSLWDALSGGNMLWYIALPASGKLVVAGTQPEIADTNLNVTIGGALSNFAIPKMIDHLLGTTSWTMITTQHLALYTDNPTAADSGTEASGGGYARLPIGFDAAVSGLSDNTSLEDFGTASADIGTVTHFGIRDALTFGNLLVFGAWDTSYIVDNGDEYKVLATALDISAL